MIYIVPKGKGENIMDNLVKTYKKQIKKASTKNECRDLMIRISYDCSAYKLSWEEFMSLRALIQEKGRAFGIQY